jgi:hypothetical protein
MSKPVQFVFYREMYGARESNGLINGTDYHKEYSGARTVQWTQPGLRITRLRLLSDPGYPAWDVSYCHGEIGDEKVRVELPFSQLPKKRMLATIVSHAKRDGVNAKRIGVFDAISTLN